MVLGIFSGVSLQIEAKPEELGHQSTENAPERKEKEVFFFFFGTFCWSLPMVSVGLQAKPSLKEACSFLGKKCGKHEELQLWV